MRMPEMCKEKQRQKYRQTDTKKEIETDKQDTSTEKKSHTGDIDRWDV